RVLAPRALAPSPTRRSSDLDGKGANDLHTHLRYAVRRHIHQVALVITSQFESRHRHGVLACGSDRWRIVIVIVVVAQFVLASAQDRKSTRLNSSHVKISYAV